MRFDQFATDAFPVHQRPQAWREALNLDRLRPDFTPNATPMYGTLTAGRSGRGFGMARIVSSPQKLHRLGEETDALWLALHLGGDAAFDDGRQAVALAPGDIVFGPAQAPLKLDFRSSFRQFIVSMPASCLKSRLPGEQGNALGHIPRRTGLGRLFSGTLTALAEAFDTLGDGDLAPVEASLSEFIATSQAAQREASASAISHAQIATMRSVCQFVDAHLSDAALSLAAVAAHERVSERLVQKLFEGIGLTFTAYLRQRRLDRCRADLANRQYGHLSISDICLRWGFNDPAHFSHSFRDRYNQSPRQFRQQANEASQQTSRKRVQRGWPSGYFEAPSPEAGRAARSIDVLAEALESIDSLGQEVRSAEPPTGPGTGRHHHLPVTAQTIHWGYFSRSIPPVLRIDSGDIVTIETLTQHAYDDHERMIKGDSGAESVFHWTSEHKAVDRRGAGPTDASIYGRGSGEGFGVHICTGPVYVQGAQPGDVLEVRILDLAPRLAANAKCEGRAFGSNAAAWWCFHYDDLIEEPKQREVVTIYEVECSQGQACAHAVCNFRWTPQRDPNGVLQPRQIELTCHRALARAGDPRASAWLERAHTALMVQADAISRSSNGAALRNSFLQNIPHHREIVAAWAQCGASGESMARPVG